MEDSKVAISLPLPEVLSGIELNTEKILGNLKIKLIERLQNNIDNNKSYLVELENKAENISFIYKGYLNSNFEKSCFGIYKFPNEDIYIGEWENDLMSGKGLYIKRLSKDSANDLEIYNGYWKDGIRTNNGIFIWAQDNNFRESFIGTIEHNQYRKGLYLKEEPNRKNNFVYIGEFDNDLRKTDNNCIYYNPSLNILFYGEIKNDKIEKGYQIDYNPINVSFSNILNYTMSIAYNKISELQKDTYIDEDVKERLYNKCADIFGLYISKASFIKSVLNEIINEISAFNIDDDRLLQNEEIIFTLISKFVKIVRITDLMINKIETI